VKQKTDEIKENIKKYTEKYKRKTRMEGADTTPRKSVLPQAEVSIAEITLPDASQQQPKFRTDKHGFVQL
jgi:hypothetical protein